MGLPWTGPWRIVSQPTSVDYCIEKVGSPETKRVVHYGMLKIYERDSIFEDSETDGNESDEYDPYSSSGESTSVSGDRSQVSDTPMMSDRSPELDESPPDSQLPRRPVRDRRLPIRYREYSDH